MKVKRKENTGRKIAFEREEKIRFRASCGYYDEEQFVVRAGADAGCEGLIYTFTLVAGSITTSFSGAAGRGSCIGGLSFKAGGRKSIGRNQVRVN